LRVPRLFLCLLLGLATSSAEASSPAHLSLAEALRIARDRHVEVLVANARVEQAIARISQAKSGLLPQFQGTASQYRRTVNLEAFGIGPGIPNFDFTPPPFNTFDARISLTQFLFDASVLARLKAAKSGVHLSLAERRKTEEDALALVANLYVEAERAEESKAYAQAQLRRSDARLALAQSRLQLGLGSAIDVTQAKAERETSRQQLEAVKANAEERRLDLFAALGLEPSETRSLEAPTVLGKQKVPAERDLEMSLSGHPDVVLAERLVEQSEHDRKTEVAAYYPRLTGSADYGASGLNPGNVDGTYSYGGQMQVPIYSGGLTQSRIHEAQAKVKENRARLEQTQIDALSKAKSALVALQQATSGLKSVDAELTRTSQELGLAQEKLKTGLGNPFEVTESQAQLAYAQDLRSEARATYYLAWVNLLHALGTMDSLTEERN